VKQVGRYQKEMIQFIQQKYSDIPKTINTSKKLDDVKAKLVAALNEFKAVFQVKA
jgi:F-type H+-transporting ATPase subunit alpha